MKIHKGDIIFLDEALDIADELHAKLYKFQNCIEGHPPLEIQDLLVAADDLREAIAEILEIINPPPLDKSERKME